MDQLSPSPENARWVATLQLDPQAGTHHRERTRTTTTKNSANRGPGSKWGIRRRGLGVLRQRRGPSTQESMCRQQVSPPVPARSLP